METTITVSNPTLKKGTFLEYTSYDIKSTIINNSNKSSSEHQVQRRYRDFLWLHESLRERNSGELHVNMKDMIHTCTYIILDHFIE